MVFHLPCEFLQLVLFSKLYSTEFLSIDTLIYINGHLIETLMNGFSPLVS